ncbi:hypothetical protein L873DRAFT_1813126 [Choiromyces venosus 120613-1]|uniref:Uncharacterized protein n=1 Tax=Choiromyces venosus 120613-1 TaxID=1336337 RepID=A0A3N4JAG5_9PEZI|nr:hypothetical protein L873DRAFT_1813126 [Choiromyces venosus 120613-1]
MTFKPSEIPITSRVQEQLAIEMAAKNNISSLIAAVKMVGAAPSTLMHHRRC